MNDLTNKVSCPHCGHTEDEGSMMCYEDNDAYYTTCDFLNDLYIEVHGIDCPNCGQRFLMKDEFLMTLIRTTTDKDINE